MAPRDGARAHPSERARRRPRARPPASLAARQASNALEARVANFLIRSLAFHVPRVLQAEIPPRLTEYMLHTWAPAVSKALLYDVLHALTHSLSSSISHHLAQAVTQGVTHSITHQLIHYYYCIYCYSSGEFCRYCYYYNNWLGFGKSTGTAGRYGRVEESLNG